MRAFHEILDTHVPCQVTGCRNAAVFAGKHGCCGRQRQACRLHKQRSEAITAAMAFTCPLCGHFPAPRPVWREL